MKHGCLDEGVASMDQDAVFSKQPPFAAATDALLSCKKWKKYASDLLTEPDRANQVHHQFLFQDHWQQPCIWPVGVVSLTKSLTTGEIGASMAQVHLKSSPKALDHMLACGRKWTERKTVWLDEPQRSGGSEREFGHDWVANEEWLERSLRGR